MKEEDLAKFKQAIHDNYFFEMFIGISIFLLFFYSPQNILLLDDIVVGAPIGIVQNKDEKTQKLYLANHLHFIIWYNNHKQVSFINQFQSFQY